MEAAKTVVLIDTDRNDLNMTEEAIKSIDPTLICISFVFADEALVVMNEQLKHIPKFIFINMDLRRMAGSECLKILRSQRLFDNSRIAVFSLVMPPTVADVLRSMGADFAFQKPLSHNEYRNVLFNVLGCK